MLVIVLIGFAIWAVGFFALGIWAIYRIAMGWMRLNDRRAIDLEQLDVDGLALFDDVGLGGDFDVAVGLRHRGDVAGRLERRHRLAVDDPHRIELVPPRRRDDALAERQR